MTATRRFVVLILGLSLVAACSSTSSSGAPATTVDRPTTAAVDSADPAKEATVDATVQQAMTDLHLRSVIVRVTIDGEEIITKAYGDSMTGVPATTDMHFRNGAVAIPYVSTLLLQLVDEGKVGLDDKVSTWLPEIPHSDEVTLGQLAQMTSGYTDYVIGNAEVDAMLYANPFRQWTPEELLATVVSKPLLYPPGTNWNYAHTNYVMLGLALEKITGTPMEELLQERVLDPLGLDNTSGNDGTPAIPEPVLHAFTSERRSALGIPEGTGFYEESTFWNPSWTITHGAIQTTDIYDLNETAVAIGTGTLLSPESFEKMTSNDLIGKTTTLPGCATCTVQSERYAYGLGLVITGDWFTQAPLFSGQAGAFAYLPSQKVAIAVAVTVTEDAFTADGSYKPELQGNPADALWRQIASAIVPDEAPPSRKG